jgi:hypothetical protein
MCEKFGVFTDGAMRPGGRRATGLSQDEHSQRASMARPIPAAQAAHARIVLAAVAGWQSSEISAQPEPSVDHLRSESLLYSPLFPAGF